MSRTKLTCTLVACAVVLLGGCERRASDEIDFGGIKNSVYQNKYFGLSVKLPAEWSVLDQEAQRLLVETGGKMAAGADKNLKAVIKASEMQTVYLFTAFKHPLGAPVTFNPGIMCLAERVRQMPGIKRGKDYLFHARKLLESGQIEYSFPSEISTESVGGQDFDVMHAETLMGGQSGPAGLLRQDHEGLCSRVHSNFLN